MGFFRRMNNLNSLFFRLLITFIAVVMPIYVLGIVIYSWGAKTVRTEIDHSSSAHVSFIKNTLDADVQTLKSLQYDCVGDEAFSEFLTEYEYSHAYIKQNLISKVHNRLRIMRKSSKYIQEAVAYIPSKKLSISSEQLYTDFDEEHVALLLNNLGKTSFPVIFNESGIYSIIFSPYFKSSHNKEPLYLISVRISETALSGLLAKYNSYQKSYVFLYDHSSKSIFSGTDKEINGLNTAVIQNALQDSAYKENNLLNIGGEKFLAVSDYSEYLNASILELVPYNEIFAATEKYKSLFFMFCFFSILIIFAYSISTYKFVHYPIRTIVNAFKHVEQGDLEVSINHKNANNEFGYLYDRFNKMVKRLNELIDKLYRQEIYARKAELKQLQSQINPHFLYNSYFILHRMIKGMDFENAQKFSSYLGKYYQYITRNSSDEVCLYQEVEHAKSYTEIQSMRFGGRLSVTMEPLQEKFRDIQVPRMILQPLLENAVEHGMKQTMKDGAIQVGFIEEAHGLTIFVEDNGESMDENGLYELRSRILETGDNIEITGFINVHRRIRLRFGSNSGLAVLRSELGGLRVEIRLILDGGNELCTGY